MFFILEVVKDVHHQWEYLTLGLGLGDGCDFMIVSIGLFWLHCNACMCVNVAFVITLMIIRIYEYLMLIIMI